MVVMTRNITTSTCDVEIMTRTIELTLLLRWDDYTARELSDISLNKMNVESVILANEGANFTLDRVTCSDEALLEASAPLAGNGCDLVDCVGKSIGWARQLNMNANLASDINLPLVEGFLGLVTSYLTPVEMSAGKAAKTQ
tara:strand:- start:143 stop:565 length:423 start_codon:yes stop_codon:yes gene_type:complete